MLPSDLKADSFKAYAPEARKLAVDNLAALRQLPLSFLPGMLREIIEYDYKFPAERRALDKEIANLRALSREQLQQWFQAFVQIKLAQNLERFDWVNSPAQFVEQLSSHLWTTHQLDAFRTAAIAYADRLRATVPQDPPPPISTSGADVVKPSFQPGNGNRSDDSTIAGRTIAYVRPGVCAINCSPKLFV